MGTRHSFAQIPVLLMGNIKNRNIFDLCLSKPGGKTAQMLNAGAFVTALDISKSAKAIK